MGIGRDCVGVIYNDQVYPTYASWGDSSGRKWDKGYEVWVPEGAYHKYPCVAVLGRGKEAEDKLYQWLKWFDDNGFTVQANRVKNPSKDFLDELLGKNVVCRMVKKKVKGKK